MRRPPRPRWIANLGWAAVGLISLAFFVALWGAVVFYGATAPYDPWNERAAPYKD